MKEIKQLSDKDYPEVFALSQFAFQYELTEAEIVKKREEAARHTIWGWLEDGALAGKLHIIPLESYLHGEKFTMGGISSVATWPSYRRKGIVKHLLQHALKEMKDNGQTISFLSPFSVAFYRKFGWELTFTEKHYRIPIEQLKVDWEAKGKVLRVGEKILLLHSIYTKYAKQYTGMLVRDEKWWEQRVLKDKYEIVAAYNEAGEAEGYLLYQVKKEILTVKEIAYTSLNGKKLLLEFMANHDSMASVVEMTMPEDDQLALLLDEPTFTQEVVTTFMARIVDVAQFLKQYPFQENVADVCLTLQITDDFFPENSGAYQLNAHDGKVNVLEVEEGENIDVYCSVQLLAAMLLGYKRPLVLYELGLIQGNQTSMKQLEELIPNQQTFFADYY